MYKRKHKIFSKAIALIAALSAICFMFTLIMPRSVYADTDDDTESIAQTKTPVIKSNVDISKNNILKNEGVTLTYNIDGDNGEIQNRLKEQSKPVDVVLLIEESTSMTTNDELLAAKNGAKAFVDEFSKISPSSDNRIGVVAFDKYAYKVKGLSKISKTTDVQSIKNEIDNIWPYDGNNLQEGILAAQDVLGNDHGRDKYIILITDRAPDYNTGSWKNRVYMQDPIYNNWETAVGVSRNRNLYQSFDLALDSISQMCISDGVKVFSIGFSDAAGANPQYIGQISSAGSARSIYTDTSKVDSAYKSIAYEIMGGAAIENISVSQRIPEGFNLTSIPTGWTFDDSTREVNGYFSNMYVMDKSAAIQEQNAKVTMVSEKEGSYEMPSAQIEYTVNGATEATAANPGIINVSADSINHSPKIDIISPFNNTKLDPNNGIINLTLKCADQDLSDAQLLCKISIDASNDGNYVPVTQMYFDDDADGVAETLKDVDSNGMAVDSNQIMNLGIPKNFTDERLFKIKVECIDNSGTNDVKVLSLINGKVPVNNPQVIDSSISVLENDAEVNKTLLLKHKDSTGGWVRVKFKLDKDIDNAVLYLAPTDNIASFDIKDAKYKSETDSGYTQVTSISNLSNMFKGVNLGSLQANKQYIVDINVIGKNNSLGTSNEKQVVNGEINFDRIDCDYGGIQCNLFVVGKRINDIIGNPKTRLGYIFPIKGVK